MDIECTKRGEIVLLGPKGSINTETAPKFEQKLLELLNAEEKRFVVDFAGVDYISSAGLRVLLMTAKRLKAGGGAIVLCSMSPAVKKVFALCGFERDFTIVDSRDRALARLAMAAPSAPEAIPAVQRILGSDLLAMTLRALSGGLGTRGGAASPADVPAELVNRVARALASVERRASGGRE